MRKGFPMNGYSKTRGESETLLSGRTSLFMASMIVPGIPQLGPSAERAPADSLFERSMDTEYSHSCRVCMGQWVSKEDLQEWGFFHPGFGPANPFFLFAGVLMLVSSRGPGEEGALISLPVYRFPVRGNSLLSNFFASLAGAFMYFATLTEIPIVQGLLGAGMGEGPALALLLAGPSLSLPSILIIAGELGIKKTSAYVVLVVACSTLAGMVYGTVVS